MLKRYFILVTLFLVFENNSTAQLVSPTDSIKNANLFSAIRSGNTEELEKSLNDGANANAVIKGYSALMAAALNGSVKGMKILLAHKADPHFSNDDSVDALWLAVPDYDKSVLLLNAGADPQKPGKEGYRPIVKLATTPGSAPLMKLFVEKGAILKQSAPDNYLLYNAAGTDDTAMLGICIRGGLSVNDTIYAGDYPIFNALYTKCFNTLQMLVNHGANVNVQAVASIVKNTNTPLMLAALTNDRQSFFYLLNHGADPNSKSIIGMTTLMYAMQAEEDDPIVTRALIDHGAVVSDKMTDGSDALYFARKMGNSESVKILEQQLKK